VKSLNYGTVIGHVIHTSDISGFNHSTTLKDFLRLVMTPHTNSGIPLKKMQTCISQFITNLISSSIIIFSSAFTQFLEFSTTQCSNNSTLWKLDVFIIK
jgi:hypothetical protein